jgi:hypothetical protein
MQAITPQLTRELANHVGKRVVSKAEPFRVANYRQLVEHLAGLAYVNRNQLLFFRGQNKDYLNKAGASTLYPAIYRGDQVVQAEFEVRFRQLDSASKSLTALFTDRGIQGHRDVARKRYIQWSILQHYQVLATPLLDVTHSLRAACSFAQLASTDPECYVFVLGLPYTTNRISIHSEEDVVNIRLLSICPPSALRPYFQEGYMVGTPDVMTNFDTKTEVDVRNRLIAKFAIPRAKHFWNSGFDKMPPSALFPSGDSIKELCDEVRARMRETERLASNAGEFLLDWAQLEGQLVPQARHMTERNLSIGEAIDALVRYKRLPTHIAAALHDIRKLRNAVAHGARKVESSEIDRALTRLREISKRLPVTISQ